jgi:hypothetical protein
MIRSLGKEDVACVVCSEGEMASVVVLTDCCLVYEAAGRSCLMFCTDLRHWKSFCHATLPLRLTSIMLQDNWYITALNRHSTCVAVHTPRILIARLNKRRDMIDA